MSPQEMALRFALLKVLVDQLRTAKSVADCEVRDTWQTGDRLTAALPNGTRLGAVTLAKGKASARLSDKTAYEQWVRQTHPDWVETVTITQVRSEHTDRLIAAASKLGEPVDAETGEVVPGITVTAGDPYPMVRLAAGAREAVAEAWRDGALGELLGGLLAIDAADGAS